MTVLEPVEKDAAGRVIFLGGGIGGIQCVLSRDASRNRPFCSSVCCIHAAKQAILTRIHSPEALLRHMIERVTHHPRISLYLQSRLAGHKVVKILCREKMQTLAAVAEVDPEKCTACLARVRECPFHVPVVNEEGVSEISPTGCRGLRSVHRRVPEKGHLPEAQQGRTDQRQDRRVAGTS